MLNGISVSASDFAQRATTGQDNPKYPSTKSATTSKLGVCGWPLEGAETTSGGGCSAGACQQIVKNMQKFLFLITEDNFVVKIYFSGLA